MDERTSEQRCEGTPASAPPGLHARLREATAALHRDLERELDLLAPTLTLDRYRCVLATFYGFYAPLEDRLRRLPRTEPPFCFALPARAALLERDLVALGQSPAELPRSAEPRPSRSEHVAGCLYVLEGASLGGQVLVRTLEQRLGVVRRGAAAFFSGVGEDTLPRWRQVLAWLDDLARAGADSEQIVHAARHTFAALGRWARCQGAAR